MLDLEAIEKLWDGVIHGPNDYVELGICHYALVLRFAGKEESDRFISSVYKLAEVAPQLVAEVERLRAENAELTEDNRDMEVRLLEAGEYNE